MKRQAITWEHKIVDGDKTFILQGRTISNMDLPEMYRRAGIRASELAFTTIVMQYPDVMVEVALKRCVISHKIGYDPDCAFRPTDFEDDERDQIMLLIMKPFKIKVIQDAVTRLPQLRKEGKKDATILNVMEEKDIKFGLENNWFTPEEAAAIEAELFLAKEHKPDGDKAGPASPHAPT
jgi:hypothetical protein